MKHLTYATIILVCVVLLAGCSRPCFHQAGTSVQQCRLDLRQCIDQAQTQQKSQAAQQVRSCMQAKGYECVDAGEVGAGVTRIAVMASSGTYWALDGRQAAPAAATVTAQQEQPESKPQPQAQLQAQAPPQPQTQNLPHALQPKPIGYRARLDDNGKHTLIPVYQDEPTDSAQSSTAAQ